MGIGPPKCQTWGIAQLRNTSDANRTPALEHNRRSDVQRRLSAVSSASCCGRLLHALFLSMRQNGRRVMRSLGIAALGWLCACRDVAPVQVRPASQSIAPAIFTSPAGGPSRLELRDGRTATFFTDRGLT